MLLVIAIINAFIREITYKPLLTPYIGIWAHQISSLTGILFFFIAIYVFLKNIKTRCSQKDLFYIGLIWLFMTIVFETVMNLFIRHLSFGELLQTYYFWKGETWIFVLLSLIFLPLIIDKVFKLNNKLS